jgi:protein SCO1/2
MTRRYIAAVLAVLVGLVWGQLLTGCTQGGQPEVGFELAAAADSPESFGVVDAFDFEERRGARVTNESLSGEPWLAAFIFTRCATICPAMTQELSHAHQALDGLGVKIVAISVDPEHDSLQVLTDYAGHFEGGLDENWLFLRGTEAETHALIRESFKLGVERVDDADPGMAISHSSRICTVDAEGRVRGYYDGTLREGTEAAVRRMRFLAGVSPIDSPLPTVNAFLNGLAALLLVLGYVAIRRGKRESHAWHMRAAFAVSAAFLVSYLYYHFVVIPAQGGPVRYNGEGVAKTAYLLLLLTHVLGAIVNLPMVLRTLWLAHSERWESHRKWARWTLPLWLYVSVTGVLVYLVLYVL